MSVSNPLTNYMKRDFLDYYNAILEDIPVRCPEWTDLTDSDFGIMLVQYFCGLADNLSFYIDRAVNESFLSTASERTSIIKLCKMLNYSLHQRYAAEGTLFIAFNLLPSDTSIPQYALFSTERDLDGTIYYFELQEAFNLYSSVWDVIKSYDDSADTYSANYAIEANTEQDFTPQTTWDTDDCLYFGHMHGFNNISIRVTTPTGSEGIWEYYADGYWTAIGDVVDGTNGFLQSGVVEFAFPYTWDKCTIDNQEMYYVRFRCTEATPLTVGVLNLCKINDLVYDWLELKEGVTVVKEVLGSSTGLANQYFSLAQTGYEEGSLVVEVDEGAGFVEWGLTTEILNESSGEKKYWIEIDENDVITVFFGDNVHGKIPLIGTSNIRATYRTCSGADGNVGYETITQVVTSLPSSSYCINYTAFEGGDDRESIEDARVNAPANLTTNERAVTVDDYAVEAKKVAGVKDAKAYENPDTYIEIWVYILATGSALPSTTLLEEVEAYLDTVKAVGTNVIALSPTVVYINYTIAIDVLPNYELTSIQDTVTETLASYISIENRSLAQDVYVSKIYELLEAIEGINYVSVTEMYKEGDAAILNNVITIDELEIADDLTVSISYSGGG